MGGRPRIPVNDVKRVVQMLSDCHDAGPLRRPQRHLAAEGLREHFDAVHLTDYYMSTRDSESSRIVDPCWSSQLDEPQREIMTDYKRMTRFRSATMPQIKRQGAFGKRAMTWRRCELLSDAAWYASDQYKQVLQPAGLDDTMRSWLPVGNDVVHVVIMGRGRRDSGFTESQRELLHITHAALSWLYDDAASGLKSHTTKSI